MKDKIYPLLKNSWIRLTPTSRLHKCPIPIIALTGGIASGKTTTAKLFQAKGIKVIDADSLVKEIYTQKDGLNFIQTMFPTAVSNEKINFKILRQFFFSENREKENIAKIESFIYQKLPKKFLEKLSSEDSFIIYDIPLLFEKNVSMFVDVKILVYAPFKEQLARLAKRDFISQSLAKKMLSSQWPIETKKNKVDFIIDNSNSEDKLQDSFEKIFEQLFTYQ